MAPATLPSPHSLRQTEAWPFDPPFRLQGVVRMQRIVSCFPGLQQIPGGYCYSGSPRGLTLPAPPAPSTAQKAAQEEEEGGGTLGQAAHEVGEPGVPVRDVDADPVAGGDERGLQVAADPVEHLELETVPGHAPRRGPPPPP